MRKKIERALFDLTSMFRAGKIYSRDHPQLREFKEKAYQSLDDLLSFQEDMIFGVVDGELAWGEEVLFELSDRLKSLVEYLGQRGIERLRFRRGMTSEEFGRFLSLINDARRVPDGNFDDILSQTGIEHIRAGRIRAGSEEIIPKIEKPVDIISQPYQDSLVCFTSAMDKVLKQEEVDYLDLRFNVLTVMESFMGRHQELLGLVSVKRKDVATFMHLLNVSILAMFFSSRLGFSRDDTLDIGIAALFHDIGKIAISRKILTKPGKLADKEFARMKDHAQIGANILLEYKKSLGILPAVVALEHHIRYDTKGYPKLPHPTRPHISSLIVSLCDVYDALTQRRTYKRDFPPDKIYAIMSKEKGGLFEPELLDRFFKTLGVWPIGSIVRLSDDRVAVVSRPNESNIFKPVVEILSPPDKGETLNLLHDKLEIEHALNPFGEGKAYLKESTSTE